MVKKYAARLVVWSAFGICTVTSISFNTLHTAMLNDSIPALVMSAIWPILAVLAVEVLIRVPWPKGHLWQVARFGGVGAVALVAMVVSYGHSFHVLQAWGEPIVTAAAGPLAIDGLMVLSGAALLAMHTRKTPARRKRTTRRTSSARRPRAVKAA